MSRLLDTAEISALQARNSSVRAAVLAHNRIVSSGMWDQRRITDNPLAYSDLPISPSGSVFRDTVYGDVLVYPDVQGTLHFNTDVPAVVITETNKPAYSSPTGNTWGQWGSDLAKVAGGLIVTALVGYLVVQVIIKKA